MLSSRRARSALIALLGAILLSALVAAPPAEAATGIGTANGIVKFPQKDSPKLKVLWFTSDWGYLGTKNANGGSYSLNLPAGSYRLQFVDQRASYETTKYAPTDIAVTVHAGKFTHKNVTMQKGAFITGTVKTDGKAGKKARVVAANQDESSFETTANDKGQFAIGGLPAGKYSLFTYDHKLTWVDKSTYAGALKTGGSANVAINLKKRAGSLRVYVRAAGKPISGHPVVTAVSKKTGQFWSVQVKGGSADFQGLYPGRYKLVANGFGIWFARTGAIQGADVKAGRADFGKFSYTRRGGWVTGTVVDGNDSSFTMKGALVSLYDGSGTKLATATADDNGRFTLSGQFASMTGLTVTADPDPNGGGWMTAAAPGSYCMFVQGKKTPVSITQGQQTEIGSVALPRSTASGQPDRCLPTS